jgi:hypothetical protein
MFRQVVSTLFKIILDNEKKIPKIKEIKEVPLLGRSDGDKQQTFKIDEEKLKERFMEGYKEYYKVMKKCLPKEIYNKIKSCAQYEKVCIPDELWSKIVYDYIIAFKKYEDMSSTILRSFEPLWFGRTFTFVKETKDMTTKEADKLTKKQAKIFFKNRDYLLKRL